MKQYLFLFIFLVFTSTQLKATDWFPIGAKWYFSNYGSFGSGEGYTIFESGSDTTIQGKICKIVRQNNYNIVNTPEFIKNHYFYSQNRKMYYYNDSVFTLLYDFSKNVGDTVMVLGKHVSYRLCDTLLYVIDSIKTESKYNNYTTQYIHYLPTFCLGCGEARPLVDFNIEFVGNTFSLFEEFSLPCDAGAIRDLRCYFDGITTTHFLDRKTQKYKLCDAIILGIKNNRSQSTITSYPNPTSDYINIDVSKLLNKDKIGIQVFDILGNKMDVNEEKINLKQDLIKINVSNLPDGIYIVKVNADNYFETFKIIKK